MVDAGPLKHVLDRDRVFDRETVFAPGRSNRPHLTDPAVPDAECPFCPGNERLLAPMTWQLDRDGGWRARAVENLYPIVAPPIGRHEVIIDAPEHSLAVEAMTADHWRNLLTAYSARYHALAADWRYVTLYRNVGRRGGASIDHPHSQALALARVPAAVRAMRARLRRAYANTGRCVLCDHWRHAHRDGARMVAESADYAVFVPEVPEVSFEVWIVPRTHGSVFPGCEAEFGDLADRLRDLLRRMAAVLGDFDHNLMLEGDGPSESPYLHWFLRLRPRQELGGGFELATGISVNPSSPAQDAATLRAAVVTDQP